MTTLYSAELTNDEWAVLRQIIQWRGPARMTSNIARELKIERAQLSSEVTRLHELVEKRHPMPAVDWRRLLISAELLLGSGVLGCALDWSSVTGIPDQAAFATLRSLQRKLGGVVRGLPPRPGDGIEVVTTDTG